MESQQAFLPQSQLNEVAMRYAAAQQEVGTSEEQWLVFSLGNELFTLSISDLEEIATINSGIAIPSVNRHVIGLISIRGEPMILVDMGQALGLRAAVELCEQHRILVLKNSDEQAIGFLVDAIIKVTKLSNWQQSNHEHHHSRFVQAITEYDGAGVSKLCPAELINSIHK